MPAGSASTCRRIGWRFCRILRTTRSAWRPSWSTRRCRFSNGGGARALAAWSEEARKSPGGWKGARPAGERSVLGRAGGRLTFDEAAPLRAERKMLIR